MAKKKVNSDIYNAAGLINDIKSVFIPDETEETLAISTYGYLGSIEAHRLQTQIQMTGELANEIFPSRARLERNIITHAIMADITDINAVPAKMAVYIQIAESDIIDNENSSNEFIIDRECPIYIGDYEFHLEYDIIIKRIYLASKATNTYSAMYSIPTLREVPNSSVDTDGNYFYLNPPSVLTRDDGKKYIYILTTISQVTHTSLNKKIITANIVDNKILTFEFDDQLAYFEIEVDESDGLKYLQPVFEGSSVPDNKYAYYCWYQYLDTNTIRIRFDRNSYMPGLNANINVLIKTSTGATGNFKYSEDCQESLTSSNYGYKNIVAYITPLSDSKDGKDRKTKEELRKLIPKELLSRGSLTTITDLNNYFAMLDAEDGRIIIQKKEDNQIERVYYAYLVAKDTNGNVLPSNTIDLKVSLDDLKRYRMEESKSDRFVLSSGACLMLGNDSYGYINHDPLPATLETFYARKWYRGKKVTLTFKVKVNDELDVDDVSVGASANGAYTPTYITPANYTLYTISQTAPITAEDYMLLSAGQSYLFEADFSTKQETTSLELLTNELQCFDFVSGTYQIGSNDPVDITVLPITIDGQEVNTKIHVELIYRLNNKTNRTTVFERDGRIDVQPAGRTSFDVDEIVSGLGITTTINNVTVSDSTVFTVVNEGQGDWRLDMINPTFQGTVIMKVTTDYGIYDFEIYQQDNIIDLDIGLREHTESGSITDKTIYIDGMVNDTTVITEDGKASVLRKTLILTATESLSSYRCYIPSLILDSYPRELHIGDILSYTLTYISPSGSIAPEIIYTLSKGLTYIPFSNYITYEDGESYALEPTESSIGNDKFVYTNPYAVSVNGYSLYSAFYMMSMEETPYIYYQWINQKSDAQFIGSNVYWHRPFLGSKNNEYTLRVEVLQSVSEDLGLFPEGETPKVKCIAAFYRDGNSVPYRYRSLRMTSYDSDSYTCIFEQNFISEDVLDNDNNIRVLGVQAAGQEESGVFTVTFSGNERQFDLSTICNNSWTVKEFLALFSISVPDDSTLIFDEYDENCTYATDPTVFEFVRSDEDTDTVSNTSIRLVKVFNTDQVITIITNNSTYVITASNKYLEYGYFNPTTQVKIYVLCGNTDIDGSYSKYDLESFAPLTDKNWTVTNIYEVVNGITMYNNYSEVMESSATPYGESHYDETTGKTIIDKLEGFYIKSVPVLGYNYCQNETLVQSAIQGLNYRKAYIDNVLELLENSFGIDFKLFNTYGPSKTLYIIKDTDSNKYLDDEKEYVDKVNLTFNFRIKLTNSKDSYTKTNIINEIKAYVEDLEDIGELHIPNLVTQITTNYQEQIDYFEYLGFNNYGPEVQHIYKDDDSEIPIDVVPEFINVNNVLDSDGTVTPDINIYLSEI